MIQVDKSKGKEQKLRPLDVAVLEGIHVRFPEELLGLLLPKKVNKDKPMKPILEDLYKVSQESRRAGYDFAAHLCRDNDHFERLRQEAEETESSTTFIAPLLASAPNTATLILEKLLVI